MYNMASKYCICIIVVCFESRLGKVLRSKCDTKGNTWHSEALLNWWKKTKGHDN